MARNGSGTYSLPAGQPVVTGTSISSTVFNTLTSDLASALTTSVSSDGQTPITGGLKALDGTAGACSYTFTASAGTGLYSPATNQAAIAAGGVQVIKFSSGATTITGTASVTGQITSTLATGTAPFVVTSTTQVANLNVATAGTAGAVAVGGITGLGTGVATALAVNVGTAGSPVVNGGALGSPSSAGTLPAHTLGGAITGNSQNISGLGTVGCGAITSTGVLSATGITTTATGINSTAIGATTPSTGAFTTLTTSGTATHATTISVGNATPSASGAGITFPATQSASTDANTLDDYEEGTWTPVIRGSGTAGTYELSSYQSVYTKVGRSMTISATMALAGAITAGGTGFIEITGVPIAKAANMSFFGAVSTSGIAYTASALLLISFITNAASTILCFNETNNNGAITNTSIGGLSASDAILFTLTYFTD